ncbi:molybdopterin cofactor-binding domain-containing protein [Streptomyces sp. V1I1]|uniref:molybdopterin cofactor-binding domain-containing protein n=1 Tax=Streptomyces sp. V1I1 TaxID=3042272 RepID=UPI00358EDE29
MDAGFAEADVIHEGTYSSPRVQHAHLETHGSIAWMENGRLNVRTSAPHRRAPGGLGGFRWAHAVEGDGGMLYQPGGPRVGECAPRRHGRPLPRAAPDSGTDLQPAQRIPVGADGLSK